MTGEQVVAVMNIAYTICKDVLDDYIERMGLDIADEVTGQEAIDNLDDIKKKRDYEKVRLAYNNAFQLCLPEITSFVGNENDQLIGYYDIKALLSKPEIALPHLRMLSNNRKMMVPSDEKEYYYTQIRSYLICFFLKYAEISARKADNPHLLEVFIHLKYLTSYTNPIVEDNYLNNNFKINLDWHHYEALLSETQYRQALELIATEESMKEIKWLSTARSITDLDRVIITLRGWYLCSCLQKVSESTRKRLNKYYLTRKKQLKIIDNYYIDNMVESTIEVSFSNIRKVRTEDKHL